ncbi:hypothetical protein CHUAL_007095 [Chamberlinius hualienensis]
MAQSTTPKLSKNLRVHWPDDKNLSQTRYIPKESQPQERNYACYQTFSASTNNEATKLRDLVSIFAQRYSTGSRNHQ